jgi:hypothetical protein
MSCSNRSSCPSQPLTTSDPQAAVPRSVSNSRASVCALESSGFSRSTWPLYVVAGAIRVAREGPHAPHYGCWASVSGSSSGGTVRQAGTESFLLWEIDRGVIDEVQDPRTLVGWARVTSLPSNLEFPSKT